MSNIRFSNVLNAKLQETPPIWLMRQAGRYHRHYQSLRKEHSFMELCKNPKLAAQVALGPMEDFDFDVAILFSDLLFPLEALGMGLKYDESGPHLGWQLSKENWGKLKSVEQAIPSLQFQHEAMKETRLKLPENKSLIGFVGGPWTLFTYAVQGEHGGSLIEAKKDFEIFNDFSKILVPLLIENIKLQFAGGAELVMIFDTAAGELAPSIFQENVLPTLETLASTFPKKLGYYSKGTNHSHLKTFAQNKTPWAGLGIDHRWDMAAELNTHSQGFLQGNFDQALLFSSPRDFKTILMKYLEPIRRLDSAKRSSWVCGLGHGVLPKTPEENVKCFVDTVREVFR